MFTVDFPGTKLKFPTLTPKTEVVMSWDNNNLWEDQSLKTVHLAKKAMEISTANVLILLAVTGCLLREVLGQQCSTTGINGIAGCECNFMGACDAFGNPKLNWAQYLPKAVDLYGFAEGGQKNLAYLCEGKAVAILYDCNSKIPLYSATVLNEMQIKATTSGPRPGNFFRLSGRNNNLSPAFQQKHEDYQGSSTRELCYKTQAFSPNYIVDNDWASAAGKQYAKNAPCPKGPPVQTAIHKGHLIASQYGRAVPERMKATFTYTNVVPQFGVFNSNPWQNCEGRLISWAKQNCVPVSGATNAQLFIVVGAIPSTVPASGTRGQRYFGKTGFSDYRDSVDYPVNVPKTMWTAACCKYDDTSGASRYRNTAFERENSPGNALCNEHNTHRLSLWLSLMSPGTGMDVNVFPGTPECFDSNNYVPLPPR